MLHRISVVNSLGPTFCVVSCLLSNVTPSIVPEPSDSPHRPSFSRHPTSGSVSPYDYRSRTYGDLKNVQRLDPHVPAWSLFVLKYSAGPFRRYCQWMGLAQTEVWTPAYGCLHRTAMPYIFVR